MCQGGIDRLCETAKESWARHPILYKYACEYLLEENKKFECEKIGVEAIRVLPENLIIRGEIVDLVVKAAEQLKHPDIIKECYESAFYSKSTLNNYLRLFELPDYQNIVDKAAKHAKMLPENPMGELYCRNKQMKANRLSRQHKDVICFFNGEFDYIYEYCKNDKVRLGWSSHFKGIAIPLFILLLDKNKKITKAGHQLINGIIYRLGFVEDNMENFSESFLRWKEKVVLTREQYEKYIAWLKEEVDERVKAVVGGGYRKSYYKAAELISALGETLESNGQLNGKTAIIEHYRKTYNRRRAFRAEFEN